MRGYITKIRSAQRPAHKVSETFPLPLLPCYPSSSILSFFAPNKTNFISVFSLRSLHSAFRSNVIRTPNQLILCYYIKRRVLTSQTKLNCDFPGIRWLRLQAPNAGGLGSILDQGNRSHLLQLKVPNVSVKIKDPKYRN